MTTIHINHETLKPYYTDDDLMTTCIYEKCATLSKRYFVKRDNHVIISCGFFRDIVTGFNIKSDNVSVGYICINGIIISTFCVAKGYHNYPYLLLLHDNNVDLVLDETYVTEVKILSVPIRKCNIMKKYPSNKDKYGHRIIKINDFGINVVYHSLHYDYECEQKPCEQTFEGCFDYGKYDVENEYDVENINPLVIIAKTSYVTKKIIQLLNFDDNYVIRDMVLHIGVMMFYVM